MSNKKTIDVDLIMDGSYPKYKDGEKVIDKLTEKCKVVEEDETKITESKYSEYFQSIMKKFGIKSLKGLEPDKKKKFFDAVDKGWKAQKKTD